MQSSSEQVSSSGALSESVSESVRAANKSRHSGSESRQLSGVVRGIDLLVGGRYMFCKRRHSLWIASSLREGRRRFDPVRIKILLEVCRRDNSTFRRSHNGGGSVQVVVAISHNSGVKNIVTNVVDVEGVVDTRSMSMYIPWSEPGSAKGLMLWMVGNRR